MHSPFKSVFLSSCLIGGALIVSACTTNPTATVEGEVEASSIVISAKRGQVLQVVAPQSREDGDAARQAYYKSVFPIATKLGFERAGQLSLENKVFGDYEPGGFIFYTWPDEKSYAGLTNHPEWPALKATRPDAWTELRIYTDTLESDLELRFDPNKHYSLVTAWFNKDNPVDYEKYLKGIEKVVEREGGRFIYKMHAPTFEAHASDPTAPDQLTFVEWSSPDAFNRVQQSDEYKAQAKYFRSGLNKFEFYWLSAKS